MCLFRSISFIGWGKLNKFGGIFAAAIIRISNEFDSQDTRQGRLILYLSENIRCFKSLNSLFLSIYLSFLRSKIAMKTPWWEKKMSESVLSWLKIHEKLSVKLLIATDISKYFHFFVVGVWAVCLLGDIT